MTHLFTWFTSHCHYSHQIAAQFSFNVMLQLTVFIICVVDDKHVKQTNPGCSKMNKRLEEQARTSLQPYYHVLVQVAQLFAFRQCQIQTFHNKLWCFVKWRYKQNSKVLKIICAWFWKVQRKCSVLPKVFAFTRISTWGYLILNP